MVEQVADWERRKHRSKRRHRSGPGDAVGIPGKLHHSLMSSNTVSDSHIGYGAQAVTHEAAPMTWSQPPPFSSNFTTPMPNPTSRSKQQVFDPQLRGQSSTQTSVTAVPEEVETPNRDSRREDDTEEEIGAWSL